MGIVARQEGRVMRRPLRHVLAALRDADIEIDCIYEATRHTEIHL